MTVGPNIAAIQDPFALPTEEGVQVASLVSSIGRIFKSYSGEGFQKGGKIPLEKVRENVNQGRIPTSSPEDADQIINPPPGYEPKPGRPSADDIPQRNLNFNNIESAEDIDALLLIDQVSEQQGHSFDTTRRGKVSHEQTRMEAEIFAHENDVLTKLLGRAPGETFGATEVVAARNLLIDSAEKLQVMAQRIKDAGAGDAREVLKFRQAVARHSAIQAQVSGMTAEAGRALNAFKIPAQGGLVRMKQIRDIVDASGGRATAEKLAILIADAGDPFAISEVTRKFAYSSKTDMLLEYWINGLLSGPTTHAVNMTGNALTAVWAVPERALAAGIRKLRASPDGVKMGEIQAQIYGMVNGFNDGLRLGWRTFKTGEPSDPLMKLEHHALNAITGKNVSNTFLGKTKVLGLSPSQVEAGGIVGKAVDLLGSGIRLPGRMLASEDEFFKAVAYRMELNAQAFRAATLEGLDGVDLAKRIQQLIENPTEAIHLSADAMAQYQTFTKPLGKHGQNVQGLLAGAPVLRFIAPFVRTPTNIIKYVGERTPVAWMSKSVRADILAGGARSDLALARISLGSMLLISGGMLGWEGKVTGNMSRTTRKAFLRKGIKPNSIQHGGKSYSINRLDPLGAFFTMSADVAQIIKYSDIENEEDVALATAVVAHAVSKSLLSKTFLRGVSEGLNAISSPNEGSMIRFFKRYPATFIPATSLIATIEKNVDPTLRETFSVLDEIKARIPGLSDDLPPRRNLWGEPIILEGGLGPDMISPVYTSTEKYSLADDEIIDNEVNVSKPKKYIKVGKRYRVDLKPFEYDKLVYLMAKTPSGKLEIGRAANGKSLPMKAYLEAFMRTADYKALTPLTRGNYIQSTVNLFKAAAQSKLLESSEDLRSRKIKLENKLNIDKTGQSIPDDIKQRFIEGVN
jgi:hypothetical protein